MFQGKTAFFLNYAIRKRLFYVAVLCLSVQIYSLVSAYTMWTEETPPPLVHKMTILPNVDRRLEHIYTVDIKAITLLTEIAYEEVSLETYGAYHGIVTYKGGRTFCYWLSQHAGEFVKACVEFPGFKSRAFSVEARYVVDGVMFEPVRNMVLIYLMLGVCLVFAIIGVATTVFFLEEMPRYRSA